jgi:hypothetical protein
MSDEPKLTVFSIPKRFEGEAATHQNNALTSWSALGVEIALLGDEGGVAEAARAFGALHLPEIRRNEWGTPLVDDAFARVDSAFGPGLRCFVNADIVLFADLVAVAARASLPALLVGETLELEVDGRLDAESIGELAGRARATGAARGPAAIDYFVFPSELFGEIPPFAVGRAGFDNWLIWRARQVARVIDVSACVLAIHQTHQYRHLRGGKAQAYYGEEAARNIALAGGRRHIYTRHDASHRLSPGGAVRRNVGATLRSRETLRKLAWKAGRR